MKLKAHLICIIALCGFMSVSSAQTPKSPVKKPSQPILSADDRAILDVVLASFEKDPKLKSVVVSPHLVKESRTGEDGSLPFLMPNGIVEGRPVPEEMVTNLRKRAVDAHPLSDYKPKLEITWMSRDQKAAIIKEQDRRWIAGRQEVSEGKTVSPENQLTPELLPCIIHPMLPGYSRDKRKAIVASNIHYGTGMCDTYYFLTKQGQNWKIAWSEVFVAIFD